MVGRWLAQYYMNASNFEKHIGTYQIGLQHGAVVLVLRQPWASIRKWYGRAQGTIHSTTETQAGRKGSQWGDALPESKSVPMVVARPQMQFLMLARDLYRTIKKSLMRAHGLCTTTNKTIPNACSWSFHDHKKNLPMVFARRATKKTIPDACPWPRLAAV